MPGLWLYLGLGGSGLFLEVTGRTRLHDDARAGEDGEDAVCCLHPPAAASQVEVVRPLLAPLVAPPGQSLDVGKLAMRLEVVLANADFVSKLLITLLPLCIQVFIGKLVELFSTIAGPVLLQLDKYCLKLF